MHKMSYKFKKMDAFATEYSDGNPAGTIWLTAKQDINESQMQKSASLHISNGSVYSQLPIKLIDAGFVR